MNMQFQMQYLGPCVFFGVLQVGTSVMRYLVPFHVWKRWSKSDIDSLCVFARFRSCCCRAWHDDGLVLQVKMRWRKSF